jgi:hypothetical protein
VPSASACPPSALPRPAPRQQGKPHDRHDREQDNRADARRQASRFRTPAAACHHDPRPRRRQRRGNQRVRHRPRRWSRPHLPLPHPDLLARVHALEATPPAAATAPDPAVTRASLQADLLAAHERTARLAAHIRQLERRLSDTLGEHAWRESGLGAPADIDALNHKITSLERQVTDVRMQLDERDQDLAAARAANRELMARLNTTRR